MLGSILNKMFGSRNERELNRYAEKLEMVNQLESEMAALDDAALKGKTEEFRSRIEKGETLDDLLPEAFAVCREAGKRALNMRHFDSQIIGGMVLHEGKIAEMKTGEGKTLVATLPSYLNAISGKGVHLITVNDYLAKRDAEWMGKVYNFLGMTVGIIQHDQGEQDRKAAYAADITYGTNNEFGFDYLRDNMKFDIESCVQRELNFAVVDEVDSILIDEARTPLIISGPAEESTDKYMKIDRAIPPLLKKDIYYTIDEKARSVMLTEDGVTKAEEILKVDNLYDPRNVEILHHVNQALKAHTIFKIDNDYVVKDDQVLIVDEFTGRLMPGRRYSDGLHQALEAKERVKIENENQTLATITFQNYFRIYNRLSGMTGTADTEAEEFMNIYKLEVIIIPTNRPMVRDDQTDLIYKTPAEKDQAIIDDVIDSHKRGQPVLVGTISIEKSEQIGGILKRKGVRHNVLNAKQHEKEAEIVAQAGRKGAVTIATNMAGRGTDIVLGGNSEKLLEQDGLDPEGDKEAYTKRAKEIAEMCEAEKVEVIAAGGLRIVGTERHESRRIDNQLRGRSGRQGDPGATRFYLSLQDDLMRIFGSDKISNLMERLGMEEGVPIEHNMVTRAIENAQKRVEGQNFDTRKHILEYDDVMNKQREVIYSQRRMILDGAVLRDEVIEFGLGLADTIVYEHIGDNSHPDEWDIEGFKNSLAGKFDIPVSVDEKKDLTIGGEKLSYEKMLQDDVLDAVHKAVENTYKKQEDTIGEEKIRGFERYILLNVLDNQWKEHLLMMDHLKEGINFRGYAQKNPLNEYKREGHDLFQEMIARFKEEVATILFRAKVEENAEVPIPQKRPNLPMIESRGELADAMPTTVRRDTEKVGRNDPCPCGSGKKYKKCHGAGK